MSTSDKENLFKCDLIELTGDEKILSHQNNIQTFQLLKNGFEFETRHFGDIYITSLRIIFIDRNLLTEFSMPVSSINHIVYKKRYFTSNFIEIMTTENEDKIVWKLMFEDEGALDFKNHLKELPISNKISTQSPLISEIKRLSESLSQSFE